MLNTDLHELKFPKLLRGSYFVAFLKPRKTAEKALAAVPWLQGSPPCKVDVIV